MPSLFYTEIGWSDMLMSKKRTNFFIGKSRSVIIHIEDANDMLPTEAKQTIETYYLFSKENKVSCVYGYNLEFDDEFNLVHLYIVEISLESPQEITSGRPCLAALITLYE